MNELYSYNVTLTKLYLQNFETLAQINSATYQNICQSAQINSADFT